MKVSNYEPRSYTEVEDVITSLKQGEKAIVALHRLPNAEIQRYIDFISGALFVLGGHANKVAPKTYELVPPETLEQEEFSGAHRII